MHDRVSREPKSLVDADLQNVSIIKHWHKCGRNQSSCLEWKAGFISVIEPTFSFVLSWLKWDLKDSIWSIRTYSVKNCKIQSAALLIFMVDCMQRDVWQMFQWSQWSCHNRVFWHLDYQTFGVLRVSEWWKLRGNVCLELLFPLREI